MSALELDTLCYGDCLDWMQRWDDQGVDRIYCDGQPWAQGPLFQEIQRAIIEQHGGQVLVRIKGNCPQTWATLMELNWELGAERSWQEERWQRSRNKHWERRSIEVFTPHPKLLPYPHAKRAYRIQHETCQRLGGPVSISHSYGITSLSEQAASAQDLLALQRGHWQVESANHYRRDVSLGEGSSRIRTGHGLSNAAR